MTNKKILVLTKYDFIGASSRLRFIQYYKMLDETGLTVTHSPLFNDNYLKKRFNNKTIIFEALWGYVKRLYNLLILSSYDIVWIEKELFPYIPFAFEKLFLKILSPYVVDYDDAIFDNYDSPKNVLIKCLFNKKIAKIMFNSSAVVVGNNYLNNYAKKAGAKNITILPTVVDLDLYPSINKISNKKIIKVGWIGSSQTIKFLMPIFSVFKKLAKDLNVEFIAIGVNDKDVGISLVKTKKWSREKETILLQDIDIGIMPLPNNRWTKGKCGYKLIQYMASFKPVIASPIGINKDIVKHGETGYLASTFKDWEKYLRILINSKSLRHSMGIKGRKIVEKKYSLDSNRDTYLNIFDELINP